MAMATGTSVWAIRMGLRKRMLMVIRRAIRCGVLADQFFKGRWRDKFSWAVGNRGTGRNVCPTFFVARSLIKDSANRE
jgi:hypothetical protein